MIANELYVGQGLGNQLWNYVLTRIIADKNQCDFSILSKHKYKAPHFLPIDFGKELVGGDSPEGGPPHSLPDGINTYYREKKEIHFQNKSDISRTDYNLLSLKPNVKFDGNCQSTLYLDGYKEKISNWLKISNDYINSFSLNNNICIIHVRCGDYVGQREVFLQPIYYNNAINYLKSINPNIVFKIISDQPEIATQIVPNIECIGSSTKNKRDTYAASHHFGGDIGEDFTLIYNAKYLIIPNSSFSWWAAYLNSNNPIVIAPKFWAKHNISDGYWSTSDIITEKFLYLDKFGNFQTAEECKKEKNNFDINNQHIYIQA